MHLVAIRISGNVLLHACMIPILPQYFFIPTELECVDTFRYLGVKIQKKLNWSDQVIEVSSKATRTLNLLRRSMHGCNQEAKTRAYCALVGPQVEYCSPVWSPNQRKIVDMLQKVQKTAARWVSGTTWDSERHRWSHSYRDLCKIGPH